MAATCIQVLQAPQTACLWNSKAVLLEKRRHCIPSLHHCNTNSAAGKRPTVFRECTVKEHNSICIAY